MLYLNTDRQVDAIYTNYPFTHESTRLIQGIAIPNTMFIAVHISILQTCGQVYISSVERRSVLLIDVSLCDALRKVDLHFQLVPLCLVSFILDRLDTPCGILQCKPQLYQCFSSLLLLSTDNISIPSRSFVFLPECISAANTKGLRSCILNNNMLKKDTIELRRNLVYLSDSGVSFAAYPDDLLQVLPRLIYINGVSAAGKHIVIKHNTLSDLRVVTKSDIQLLGVADV